MKNKPTDKHHLFWYRKDYNKGLSKRLRNHWYCSLIIPKNTLHRYIHHHTKHIPVPSGVNIRGALEQLELLEKFGGISKEDPIEKRLIVLMALFDYCEPKTYNALKSQYNSICDYYRPRIYEKKPL